MKFDHDSFIHIDQYQSINMNKDIFVTLKSFSHDYAIIAFMQKCKTFYAHAQNFVIDAHVPISKINEHDS